MKTTIVLCEIKLTMKQRELIRQVIKSINEMHSNGEVVKNVLFDEQNIYLIGE